ncbi:MAG: polysaccharide deacetylase family protein [Sphingomonadales bacterium]|nr:polysaccharide deacetylase family protein [Sphingomonadales bacterium]
MASKKQETRKRNLGRLDHVARKADRVSFPADFGRRYVIYVDTEEEFDWTQPQRRDATGTSHMRYLPEFQKMAESHGASPCYLVDWPIIDTPSSAEVINQMLAGGHSSVGTQLHPWVNPPFEEEVNAHNSYVCNLPVELQRAKLHALTDRIAAVTGKRPEVYRAGRYGVGQHTAELLVEAGYKVDTSIRPYFDYSADGGPSFLKHNPWPSWAGPDGSLIELPLSVAYVGRMRGVGAALSRYSSKKAVAISALSRSGMLSRVALTPEDMPEAEVRQAIDALLADGQVYLSISFHSPSVAPGHTPYVRNSAELSLFYDWWDIVLNHLHRHGVKPASVEDVIAAAWVSRGL